MWSSVLTSNWINRIFDITHKYVRLTSPQISAQYIFHSNLLTLFYDDINSFSLEFLYKINVDINISTELFCILILKQYEKQGTKMHHLRHK